MGKNHGRLTSWNRVHDRLRQLSLHLPACRARHRELQHLHPTRRGQNASTDDDEQCEGTYDAWGIWGLNHCALAFLKCWAIKHKDEFMLKFTAATAAITLGYLVMGKQPIEEDGGDVDGFIG